jgi:hypothetical protein
MTEIVQSWFGAIRLTLYARCHEDVFKSFCNIAATEFFSTERNKHMVVGSGKLPATLQIAIDGLNGGIMQWQEAAFFEFCFANHQSFRRNVIKT